MIVLFQRIISLDASAVNVTLSWDALESADSYYVVYYLPGTGWQEKQLRTPS